MPDDTLYITIDKLREQLERETALKQALLEKQEEWAEEKRKIYNLSRYAWQQVDRKPEEAKDLFKWIHSIASGGEYMFEHPSFYKEEVNSCLRCGEDALSLRRAGNEYICQDCDEEE